MEEKRPNLKDLEFFYNDYEEKLPFVVLIKIIFTLGLYIIWWLYKINIELEKVDETAPEANRSIIILYVIPPFIFLISIILNKLIQLPKNITLIIDVILWSLAIFLSLKYIYDLCICFGKWTGSNGLFWYLFIYPGYFSIILYFFDFYYTLPLIFFTIIAIPGMQGFMNIKERKFREMYEHERFNHRTPALSNR